jgi:hypothetical protein
MVEFVFENDPFATLRLLQVCGVNRSGHVLNAVSPQKLQEFVDIRDEAVAATFVVIHLKLPPS